MVLSDRDIRHRLKLNTLDSRFLAINPFSHRQLKVGRPSHGLQSFGYDLVLADQFASYAGAADEPLDPLRPETLTLNRWRSGDAVVPPGDMLLGSSVEWLQVPNDCTAVVVTKSTWARLGLCLNCTPLEAGWRGRVTLELANVGRRPIRVTAGVGIGQVVFLQGAAPCEFPYGGVYQDQLELTGATVRRA